MSTTYCKPDNIGWRVYPDYSMASIKPNAHFAADTAASALRQALKGCGTNEKKIAEVLSSHTNRQRQEIKETYNTLYSRELLLDFKEDLSGRFARIVFALMDDVTVFLSNEILHAMKGLGTDEGTLIEILCTRSFAEINSIKSHYKTSYGREMEKDIEEETSGDFWKLLKVTMNIKRSESLEVDHVKAVSDAKSLYEAGAGRLGTDEELITSILCSRSFAQLRATFIEYEKQTGNDIEKDLISETSGDLKSAYVALIKIARDTPGYFAERLNKSIKGLGTNESQLTRILVTRSEIDLAAIGAAYQSKYGSKLSDALAKELGGDYKHIVLAIVGNC